MLERAPWQIRGHAGVERPVALVGHDVNARPFHAWSRRESFVRRASYGGLRSGGTAVAERGGDPGGGRPGAVIARTPSAARGDDAIHATAEPWIASPSLRSGSQ
jgi:hypothetical protein